jgi:hypothetical protein
MPMARYALRYFFDPGSGICLWAGCPAARERFGYPVAARQLPLPRATRERMAELVDWYDQSVDWEYPAGPSLWDRAEHERFARAARHLLSVLRVQLGPDFVIHDELAPTLPP